jgi:hypothetical protein
MFEDPNNDPGDKYDSTKWDFDESDLIVIYINNYPYKINNTNDHQKNLSRANRLAYIRSEIDRLCFELCSQIEDGLINKEPDSVINGVFIFLDLHAELPRTNKDLIHFTRIFNNKLRSDKVSSRYLISEIPRSAKSGFIGLNIPRMRYRDPREPFVGPDQNIRACYRDVFLNDIIVHNSIRSKEDLDELRSLIIHELAHSLACHVTFRDDDHGPDFKKAEKILSKIANKINFLPRS